MSEHSHEHRIRWHSRVRHPKIGVVHADPAPGTADSGAAMAEQGAARQLPDDNLVQAAVAGDIAARDRLLAAVYPLVLRYCRARLGRQSPVFGSADDVAQEVCLAVVTALPSYVISGRPFQAFVYGIAAHKVTDAFRAMVRNRTDPVADLPDRPVLHDGPEKRLLAEELAERLTGLLQLLTPRQREVLILRVAVGLSGEETAEAVGSTPGAVRVTQHRALDRLRTAISSTSPGDGSAAACGVTELLHYYAS
jgi:RNA polymerase sigma-70 factor, ECF subfamily